MIKPLFYNLLVLMYFLVSYSHAAELPKGIISLDGKPASEFVIRDYDDNEYRLSQSRGRWVFVHFWASWCGPCRREMPELQALSIQLNDQAVDIILINTSETEDEVFSFLSSVAPELHSYMDKEGEITEQWSPRGLPATFFIDPQGKRRYLALGGRPWMSAPYQAFIKMILSE